MGSELPDIRGIEALPRRIWHALRSRLHRAGFVTGYPDSVRHPAIGAQAESLQRPIVLWHLRRRGDAPATAFRMFVLGDPVAARDARDVLGRDFMDDLLAAGLLRMVEPDAVVSPFVLRVYRGFLV